MSEYHSVISNSTWQTTTGNWLSLVHVVYGH